MLRQCLQTTHPHPRHWRGPAMLCVVLVLVSLWLCAGCQPTALRTSPTPPTAETPAPEPDSPQVDKQLPATAPPALPPATGPYVGITETGEPPPDDYYGNPLFWIPGMEYETFYSAPDEPDDEAARERAVAGYHRLMEMNPNSARVTHDLGRILSRADEFEESVHLLKKAAQLDTRYQESAFLRLAMSYYGVGDKEQALAYLKRLAAVALTQRAREKTRKRIEALEQHGEWLLFVD